MAPKEDDDPVIAEYDVFLTPPISEEVFLVQYPNRPRDRPYSAKHGLCPNEMRIKPNTGFLEVDIKINTGPHYNKYMGLKWGEASRVSKEVHNPSGTYGPAAGLARSQPQPRSTRARNAPKTDDNELNLENDLHDFNRAIRDDKVLTKLTLGGQIARHDEEIAKGKPNYFVGAFKDDTLTLTKVTGTCQMRPHFHYLDAEDERSRIATQKAQAAEAPPPPSDPKASGLRQHRVSATEMLTPEYRLKQGLQKAEREEWVNLEYVDEDDELAYEEFDRKFKVADESKLPILKSQMDAADFLDAMSGLSPTRRKKRASRKKEMVDLDAEDADGEGEGEDGSKEGDAGE